MALNLETRLTPVDTSKVDAALRRLQRQARSVDFGGGARSLDKLSRPLGKITGQATEFQKSLEASNARVLAFGASVVVINKLSEAFGGLLRNTVKVEETFAKINTILGGSSKEIEKFGKGIFDVSRQTGTAFEEVADGALELARQGLSVEETLTRVNVALQLVRVTGIDSQKAVGGLTAAVKSFSETGISVTEIADKLSAVDTKFAVSTQDLIDGLQRASATARNAGVSFDELLALITTVQERTQRGGSVIGNAFKTIFGKIKNQESLKALDELGIKTLDASNKIRPATAILQELGAKLEEVGFRSVAAQGVLQKVAGERQKDILLTLLEEINKENSQFNKIIGVSINSVGSLSEKNDRLNDTLAALLNSIVTTGREFAATLGQIGGVDIAKELLGGLSNVLKFFNEVLDGEGAGSKFARGLVKGIGTVLLGPGLALVGAIFVKLFVDLAKFSTKSLADILKINSAAKEQKLLQDAVLKTFAENAALQKELLSLDKNKLAQAELLLKVYQQQTAALAKAESIAAGTSSILFSKGVRAGTSGVTAPPTKRGADGYIAGEKRDVSRGVGGAPASSKVVTIPNFAFGKGKRGTMVANDSEYYVQNYSGGGDAIFNQDMAKSIGLPDGAKKIRAAGGFIPNFVKPSIKLKDRTDITTPEQARAAGYSGASIASRFGAQGIRAKQRSATQAAKAKNSLILDAKGRIGIASLFAESSAKSTTTTKFSSIEKKGLQKAGFGNVRSVTLSNLQNSSLTKYIKNKKANEKSFRKQIAGLFAAPAYELGASIIGEDFQNDEASKIQRSLQQKIKDPNLFSTSVQGGLFESAIKLITKGVSGISEFKSNKDDRIPFDFEEGGRASSRFKKAFGFSSELQKADAKRTSTSEAIRSLIGKTIRDPYTFKNLVEKKTAAQGYIPNFADPLREAIDRERAAGVPINQIRINQSGKLRNGKNPNGLAVTNTRDEPTGRIPNFAAPRGQGRDNLGSILLLQTVSLGLATTFQSVGEEADGFAKYAARGADALQGLISTVITLQLLGLKGGADIKGLFGNFKTAFSAAKGGLSSKQVAAGFGGKAARSAVGTVSGKVGAFFGASKGLTKVSSLFFKFIPILGPVVLGLTALNGALKIFTGQGIIGNIQKALSGNSDAIRKEGEARRQSINSIYEEARARSVSSRDAFQEQRGAAAKALVDLLSDLRAKKDKLQRGSELQQTYIPGPYGGTSYRSSLGFFGKKALEAEIKALEEEITKTEDVLKTLDSQMRSFGTTVDASFRGATSSFQEIKNELKTLFQGNEFNREANSLTAKLEADLGKAAIRGESVKKAIDSIASSVKISSDLTDGQAKALEDVKIRSLEALNAAIGRNQIDDDTAKKYKDLLINAKDFAEVQDFLLDKDITIKDELIEIGAEYERQNRSLENQARLASKKLAFEQKIAQAQSRLDLVSEERKLALIRKEQNGGLKESISLQKEATKLADLKAEKTNLSSQLLKAEIAAIAAVVGGSEEGQKAAEETVKALQEQLKVLGVRLNIQELITQQSEKDLENARARQALELRQSKASRGRDAAFAKASGGIEIAKARGATGAEGVRLDFEQKVLEFNRELASLQDEQERAQQNLNQAKAGEKDAAEEALEVAKNNIAILKENYRISKEIAEIQTDLSISRGVDVGLTAIRDDVQQFQYKLGVETPQVFASSMGQVFKDAVSGAESVSDALRKGGEAFLGYMRDAFLQQAADQLTLGITNSFKKSLSEGGALSGLAKSFGGKDAFQDPKLTRTLDSVGGIESKAGSLFGGMQTMSVNASVVNVNGAGGIGGATAGASPVSGEIAAAGTPTAAAAGASVGAGADDSAVDKSQQPAAGGIFQSITSGFQNVFSTIKNVGSDLFGGLFGEGGVIKGMFSKLFGEGGFVGGLFKNLTGGIGGLFKNIFGGLGGGGAGAGGFFSNLFGSIGGGLKNIGSGISGFFSNIFGGFNSGGFVGGRGPNRDTVPAMLTPGEFVLNRKAVDSLPIDFIKALNEGKMPIQKFQQGGIVSGMKSALSGAGMKNVTGGQVNNSTELTFNIAGDGGEGASSRGSSGRQNQEDFARRIKQAVTTVIQEESRTGGSLGYLYGR
jgi:TP901 family phage tail tape measure protein